MARDKAKEGLLQLSLLRSKLAERNERNRKKVASKTETDQHRDRQSTGKGSNAASSKLPLDPSARRPKMDKDEKANAFLRKVKKNFAPGVYSAFLAIVHTHYTNQARARSRVRRLSRVKTYVLLADHASYA